MCGIAGFYLRQNPNFDRERVLGAMTDAVAHRGPEHEAKVLFDHVGLGHRRLKIIDLEGGNQPIYNETGEISVIFNGEIYNYRELRKELEASGHIFRTQSDTEVIVHAYEEYGLDFLCRLNAMAAIALYDKKADRLILARDRRGIKPLFYGEQNSNLFFTSDLAAFRCVPQLLAQRDWAALAFYLDYLYIPQPASAYLGIQRIPPGHYLEVSREGTKVKEYSRLEFSPKSQIARAEAQDEVIRLVKQAVKRQLMADVPVGVFLSSGLDSIAVLAAAVDSGARPDCFTLSFSDPAFDEGRVAESVAAALGVPFHRVELSAAAFVTQLAARLSEISEPMPAWVNVGKKLLAGESRARKIPVALSGAGGDELFCGYPTVNAAQFAQLYARLPAALRRNVLEPLVRHLPAGQGSLPWTFAAKSFVNAAAVADPLNRFLAFKEIFSSAEHSALLTADGQEVLGRGMRFDPLLNKRLRDSQLEPIDQMSLTDMETFLEGSILFWADNATMVHAIEEREPLLDDDLVSFAARLPIGLKYSSFRVKPLLHDSLSRWLSETALGPILKTYRKRGFSLPLNRWLSEEPLRSFVQDQLSPQRLQKTGLIQPDAGRLLLEDQLAGRENNFRKIQALVGLVNHLDVG